MANSVGSLFVELGVNTAAFAEGMSKATYSAKLASTEIGSALNRIGGVLGQLGNQFGQFGGVVGQSLGSVGASIVALTRSFGSLNGVMGAAKIGLIGFGGVAAGAATAGGVVIAMAVKASEAANRLYLLSQATGTSVKELSGLSIVGKMAGVDIEALAHSLERMDRMAIQASLSPNRVNNGYRQLGITVTDTNGKLKPTIELFGEVADKFSMMQDGTAKTAIAMQIFGRAGAQLIPVLNQGSAAIKYWLDYGTKVGAVLSDQAAKGAHEFQNQLTKMGLVVTGVQNKLMEELVPALQHITASLTTFLEKGHTVADFGNLVGKALVQIAGIVYEAAFAWEYWSDKIDIWEDKWHKFTNYLTSGELGAQARQNYINKHPGELIYSDAELDADIAKKESHIQSARDRLAIQIADLEFKGTTPVAPEPRGKKREAPAPIPVTKVAPQPEKDIVGEFIEKTDAATQAELKLAAAVGQSQAALILAKGEQEAIKAITEVRSHLEDRLTGLKDKQKEFIAAGEPEKAKALGKNVADLEEQMKRLNQESDRLTKEFIGNEVLKTLTAASDASLKQVDLAAQQTQAQQELNAAKLAGVGALDSAQVEEKLKAQQVEIQKAREEYELLSKTPGIDPNVVQAASSRVRALEDDLTKLRANFTVLQQSSLGYWDKLREEVDQARIKFGTFGQGIAGVIDEMIRSKSQLQESFFTTLKNGFDGLEDSIAKFVVTGKGGFIQLLQSIEIQLVKLGLQLLLSKALMALFGSAAAAVAATDIGTKEVGRQAAIGDAAATAAITAAWGGPGAAIAAAALTVGALEGITALEAGGPVVPGQAYLVGERRPEIFMPNAAGRIIPRVPSGGSGGMMGGHTVNVHTSISTINSRGFEDLIEKHARHVGRVVHKQLRTSNMVAAGARG